MFKNFSKFSHKSEIITTFYEHFRLCQLVEMIFVEVRETTVDQHWPTIIKALETMWNLVHVYRHKQMVVAALRYLNERCDNLVVFFEFYQYIHDITERCLNLT